MTLTSAVRPPVEPDEALNYRGIYASTPLDRIGIVKRGLPAAWAKQVFNDLRLPTEPAHRALHLSTSTLNRKIKNAELLTQDESERVLGLVRLVGQVQAMVDESGEPQDFDVGAWTARWLSEPLPALGGARPLELLDTMEGQALLSDTLAAMQVGAYA